MRQTLPIDAGTLWELFKGAPPFHPRPTTFPVVPGVLQVCEVALEGNLLGGSKEVQFLSSGVETTGQQVSTGGNNASDNSWSPTTGDYFD